MSGNDRRVKFSYFLKDWKYDGGDVSYLESNAERVTAADCVPDMYGHIFCPVCFTNLSRVPNGSDNTTSSMLAHYRHLPSFSKVKCDLRTPPKGGKKYDTYEDAMKAINNRQLVIVHEFMKERPEAEVGIDNGDGYDGPVEDVRGPVTNKVLGRHNGESFDLPSRATTVYGICRNFEENLYRYYFLPGQKGAFRLIDLLNNAYELDDLCDKPKLYWGRITRTKNQGTYQLDHNIRMTFLEFKSNDQWLDLCIKTPHSVQAQRGIDDSSVGRVVLVYGKVKKSGMGLCFTGLNWGELALLPKKYEDLLD